MKIIAEIGSCWHTLDDILQSIPKAKLAGATAFKLQMFCMAELYGPHHSSVPCGTSPVIVPFWLPEIKLECDKHEIEFMCTAFSPAGYEYVNKFVDTHKIASAELTDISILKTVNSFGKPVYLSTAGSDIYIDIKNALLHLTNCPVTIMFCVADYPARIVDFNQLNELKKTFGYGYSYGYSDHSIDVLNIPYLAKHYGCSVIEKHVNFTNHKDTDDAPHSLNATEFALMVRRLNGEEIAVSEIEKITNIDMRSRYKRKFIAIEEIKAGDKFILDKNVGIHRAKVISENPVITFRHWDIEGRTAMVDKKIGDVICYPDIEL